MLANFQKGLPWGEEMGERTYAARYDAALGWVGGQTTRKLQQAAASTAYRAQTEAPLVYTFLGDDASQFDGLAVGGLLCSIHEPRHYAKLTPMAPQFQEELGRIQDRFRDYHRQLRAYSQAPSRGEAGGPSKLFDDAFSAPPAYEALPQQVAKTLAGKAVVLQVLDHPEFLLHNNASQLGARQQVRKRDVSLGPRTAGGGRT